MDLRASFKRSANIGILASQWLEHFQQQVKGAGSVMPAQTGPDGAVSLIAPAALLARLIDAEYEGPTIRALRVLVISEDPIGIMDSGVWCNYAAEFAGLTHGIELFGTSNQTVQSSMYPAAVALGLSPFTQIAPDDAQSQAWDLVAWVHPVVEREDGAQACQLVKALVSAGAPVYACVYNELDAYVQAYGLNAHGMALNMLGAAGGNCEVVADSVNRHGISIKSTGVDGGWGALLGKIGDATESLPHEDWRVIRTAMNLTRLEGVREAPWCYGERVSGVAFGKSKPVGLIGNMAVDSVTGLILTNCTATSLLNVIGHAWDLILTELPVDRFKLLPWAARAKLCFNQSLSKETKARQESIDLLEADYRTGMIEAGIALARGYEAIGTEQSVDNAFVIYREIGGRHPMSIYALAHEQVRGEHLGSAESLFLNAAAVGYAPAITDLAKLMYETGRPEKGLPLLETAAHRGDAEASFIYAEELIHQGEYAKALISLRASWSSGYMDALDTAEWLCGEMLANKLGNKGNLQRELKDIRFNTQKRKRFADELSKAFA